MPRITSVIIASLMLAALAAGTHVSPAGAQTTISPLGGYLSAWGSDDHALLGTGFPPCCPIRPFPVPVNLRQVVSVGAGGNFTLAAAASGFVYAWGNNARNEFGLSSGGGVYTPRKIPELTHILQVAAGDPDSIALRSGGDVWEWGQLADRVIHRPRRLAGLSQVRQIAASGSYHLAIRRDGTVWAWGTLDASGIPAAAKPVKIAVPSAVAAVAIGGNEAFALTKDGAVYVWGANLEGQMGVGPSLAPSPIPVLGGDGKTPLRGVVQIAAGARHAVALMRDGTVLAWGQPPAVPVENQLPIPVSGLSGISAIAAGDDRSFALRKDGSVLAWGSNLNGALGTGKRVVGDCPDPRASCLDTPTLVKGLHGALLLSVGRDHIVAISRSPVAAAPRQHPHVCTRATGVASGVVLKAVHLRGIAVDSRTGRLFVLSPGGYDFNTGDWVCASGVTTLDGRSGRILHSATIGSGTAVSGFGSIVADPTAGRAYAATLGDFQVTGRPGSMARLDAAGRFLGKVSLGSVAHLGNGPMGGGAVMLAADPRARRVYALTTYPNGRPLDTVILDSRTGAVVKRSPVEPLHMAVDQTTNRLFLVTLDTVTTLNATTGVAIGTIGLPPGHFAGVGVDELTGRVFIAEVEARAPASQNPGPATISVLDATTGRTITRLSAATRTLPVGVLVVDGPAGVVLSSSGSHGVVLDARSGAVRRTITLPNGGFAGNATVDPSTGHIYGFASGGIMELDPRTWRSVRLIPGAPTGGPSIVPDDRAGRIFALESHNTYDDVRAICLRPSCR